MKKHSAFAIALAFTVFHGFFGVVAEAGQKVEVRISTFSTMEHPSALGLQVMKEYVERETNGEVVLHLFPNSQLGDEHASVEQVQMGTLEMAIASIAPMVPFQEKFAVMDIPFLFDNYMEAWAFLDSQVGTDLLRSFEEVGLYGLGYLENGYRHTTNNIRPITSKADLAGLKIRTMQSPLHIKSFQAIGANPTPVPYSELYMALSQRIVDGQENPIANIWDAKMVEVQKYLSLTGHIYDANLLVTNLKWFKRLSPEHQAAIRAGAILGQNYSRFVNANREAMIIERLREQGMQVNEIDLAAKNEIKSAAQPAVIEDVKRTVGAAYVEEFLGGIKKVKEDTAKSLD